MTSQKPRPEAEKKPHELTTDEAMRRLFHPDVVEQAKKHAREAEAPKSGKKAMSED